MQVRGRGFDFSKAEIEEAMRGQHADTIHKHVVEMIGTVFPPKQVVAVVTGWDRLSFTTAEAQRVLTGAGFRCREAAAVPGGGRGWVVTNGGSDGSPDSEDRIAELESAVATVQQAIAGLAKRVRDLEDGRDTS